MKVEDFGSVRVEEVRIVIPPARKITIWDVTKKALWFSGIELSMGLFFITAGSFLPVDWRIITSITGLLFISQFVDLYIQMLRTRKVSC